MLDFQKATDAIKHHENILILPSSPVDGDSIGSALAVYSLLQSLGKNATVVLTSEIPDIYRFMPNIDSVQKTAKLYSDFMITIDLKNQKLENLKHEIVDNKVNIIVTPEQGSFSSEQVTFPEPKKYFDLLITVDCADLTQLGSFYKQNYAVFSDIPSINIDHHVSNKNFGSLNLVDTEVSSTTQLLFDWFKSMNAQIDEDIATLLLAGIITDTGSFQNANTTPQSFDAAAELIDLGGRQQEIIRHVYKTKQLNSLKLWGKILSKIQVNETYRYLWSSATQNDFKQTGTISSDKGDIIDELMSNAQEADVILLLEEKPDGSLHGSLRSTSEDVDISPIAQKYNGGGHSMASGFTIPNATVDTHQNQILQTIEEFQRNRLESSTNSQSPETKPETLKQPQEQFSPSPIFQANPAESISSEISQVETPPAPITDETKAEPVQPTDKEKANQSQTTQEESYEIQLPNQVEVPLPQENQDQSEESESTNLQPTQNEDSLDNLPSVDDIIIGTDNSSPQQNEFSPENLSDPSEDSFDPLDLQEELNNFNQTFQSDPIPENQTPANKESDIDKLTRDFVSKEDQNENQTQSEDNQ
jgi:phosphoesterase RecJ-like protein